MGDVAVSNTATHVLARTAGVPLTVPSVETPFGLPSDALVTGTLHGVRMAFLPRHGRGHRLAPHELPFRANIHAMKQLGMKAYASGNSPSQGITFSGLCQTTL